MANTWLPRLLWSAPPLRAATRRQFITAARMKNAAVGFDVWRGGLLICCAVGGEEWLLRCDSRAERGMWQPDMAEWVRYYGIWRGESVQKMNFNPDFTLGRRWHSEQSVLLQLIGEE